MDAELANEGIFAATRHFRNGQSLPVRSRIVHGWTVINYMETVETARNIVADATTWTQI